MRNFQNLTSGINVTPLLNQLYRHSELWNRDRIRTEHEQSPHSQCDDILLRFQTIQPLGDYSLKRSIDAETRAKNAQLLELGNPHGRLGPASVIDDCECIWYPAWDVLTELHSILFNLCRTVCAERIGRILISRLAPGKVITPHEDGGAVATYYTRYQLPLQSEAGCVFDCDGERVQMAPGQLWWFRNSLTHSVTNNSATDRIACVIDLRTR